MGVYLYEVHSTSSSLHWLKALVSKYKVNAQPPLRPKLIQHLKLKFKQKAWMQGKGAKGQLVE